MGVIKAFSGALSGTFADQWKDIWTAGRFSEQTAVVPGVLQSNNNGRGSNYSASNGIITNGSKIFVPENTAAFILSQGRIEEIIAEPGGYEYQNGEESILNGDGIQTVFSQIKDRFTFGGQPSEQKEIAFVNLREIRNIKFGTKSPLVYNDKFYGTDLEILAFGSFSIMVKDVTTFIRQFLPANTTFYSFETGEAREQIVNEFLQSFMIAVNRLSEDFRVSQLPGQASVITETVKNDGSNAGTWLERFGLELQSVALGNIEFSKDSKELVRKYSENKMSVDAYSSVSKKAADISAQQKIAEGIRENGLGDGAGMVFGMNYGTNLNGLGQSASDVNELDQQVSDLKKIKELLDTGILTQEEFDAKKKQILGL